MAKHADGCAYGPASLPLAVSCLRHHTKAALLHASSHDRLPPTCPPALPQAHMGQMGFPQMAQMAQMGQMAGMPNQMQMFGQGLPPMGGQGQGGM